MRFGQAITTLLREYDVDTVFGIPGVHTIELFRGLEGSGIRGIVPRHEQGAAFMADGYFRSTNRPGVCVLISGPGVLNAMTPIAQAWHDSVPMLIIASTVASTELGKHRGALHDVPDQAKLMAPLTSISETVTDPDRFSQVLADAFHSWATGRRRPVHIAIPVDILSREVGVLRRLEPSAPKNVDAPIDAALETAITHMQDAHRPVIIAGGGANRAATAVRHLAERLDAPVVTTGNARGVLREDHRLATGTSLPFRATQTIIAEADLVIAIGTEFSETEVLYTGSPLQLGGRTVRIDIDPRQADRDPTCIPIVGDATVVCERLIELLGSGAADRSGATRAALAREGLRAAARESGILDWIDAVAESTPPDAIVAVDSAQLAYQAHHFMPWHTTDSWMASFGLGTLGPALPMAVGAAIGNPTRPVLALAGDGGVLFTIAELATAADLNRQLTLVIWDNRGYGEIRTSFDNAGIPRYGTDISSWDLELICKGFGATTTRVSSPAELSTELRNTYKRSGVSVVIATDPHQ